MKKQVDELHSKLEDACCERDSLQQQVCSKLHSRLVLKSVRANRPLSLSGHGLSGPSPVCTAKLAWHSVLQLQLHQHLHIAQSAGLLFLATIQDRVNDMVSEVAACCRWRL